MNQSVKLMSCATFAGQLKLFDQNLQRTQLLQKIDRFLQVTGGGEDCFNVDV